MQRALPSPEIMFWLAHTHTMHCFQQSSWHMYNRASCWFDFKTSVNHVAEPNPFQICVDRVTSQTLVSAAGLTSGKIERKRDERERNRENQKNMVGHSMLFSLTHLLSLYFSCMGTKYYIVCSNPQKHYTN